MVSLNIFEVLPNSKSKTTPLNSERISNVIKASFLLLNESILALIQQKLLKKVHQRCSSDININFEQVFVHWICFSRKFPETKKNMTMILQFRCKDASVKKLVIE